MISDTEGSRRTTRHKKKKKSLGKTILMVLGFVLLFVATVALTIGFLTIRPPSVSTNSPVSNPNNTIEETKETRAKGIYSVLVVGTDQAGLNTDTIMVASLDSKHNRVSVMSIPRDTMSNVSRNIKKINAAYANGAKDGEGNIDNLKQEVSYLMGFPVDNYVIVDLTAFEELIDALGGVTIDVPIKMDYDDPYQDLHIHIEKGLQTLNGKDAIGFVRYRKGYAQGDLGRVKAQQLFISALAQQAATPATITKLPQLTDIVLDNMTTDLTYGELVWFAKEAVTVDMANDLHMFTLPGVAETVKPDGSTQALSYYLPYEDEILEIVNEYFNPYSRDLVSLHVVDTDALLKKAGIQREERKQQAEQSKDTESENQSDTNTQDSNENNKSDESSVAGADIKENDTADEIYAEEVVDPNTQAPDEVLKGEEPQNDASVDVPVDEPTVVAPPEELPTVDEPVQSGGIPGEVLKSDLE